jgi:hypothetical protein
MNHSESLKIKMLCHFTYYYLIIQKIVYYCILLYVLWHFPCKEIKSHHLACSWIFFYWTGPEVVRINDGLKPEPKLAVSVIIS